MQKFALLQSFAHSPVTVFLTNATFSFSMCHLYCGLLQKFIEVSFSTVLTETWLVSEVIWYFR